MEFPEPVIEIAIEPKSKADQEKLGVALAKLAAEEPSFRGSTDLESGQTILKGMGELHLDIKVDILRRTYKVDANIGAPQVAFRERVTKRAEVDYTHKKQTGGTGQFARVKFIVEPNEPGKGFEFESKVVGGAVPKEYIPGVEKGLNKSHSCSYALLAYQTAYLKTHYPVEFMAALLTSEAGNTEKVVKYINEARGMSISILPPDVNESDLYFTPVGESIRFGLAAIKNVGENTAKAIRESRLSQGEFKSLYDFCKRIESRFLNKRVFESLIKSGAMDSLGPRESMLASVDDALAALQRASRLRESGQHGLFGTAVAPAPVPFELREAAPWSEEERLASEYAMLGFYVSGHPLAKYASRLMDLKTVSLDQVEDQRNGKDITVAALIVGTRPMRSKKGSRWAIFTIQDMTGVQELLAFPESFARLEQVLKPGNPLLLKVRVQVEEAGTRLSLQDAGRLEEIAERAASSELRVRIEMQSLSENVLDRLEDLFAAAPGPCQVVFELCSPDGSMAVLQAQQRVKTTPEFVEAVREICGSPAVRMVLE